MIVVRSFDASAAQKGMWLAQKMSPETLNHALVVWDVDGELDAVVMESAFRRVLDEAEVLRVTFVDDDGEPRQVPRELGDWRPFLLDCSAAADPEQAAREALANVVGRPFDLERDLLLRLGVVRLGVARSLVVIAYHHMVSDGFGAGGLLSQRLAEVYTALARGSEVPPLPHPWDAEPFAAEAAAYQSSEQFAEDTEFWRDYLADAPGPAQVPRVAMSDASRAALAERTDSADRWAELADSIGMVSRTLTVPCAEAAVWTDKAKSLGVWMSSLLTAAAAVYFRHRCDRPEFLLSLAVGNRVGVAARTPGLAVNVVPVRMRVPLAATFAEIADAVVDETYEIFGHTTCHYSDIQRASGTVLSGRGAFGVAVNVVEFAEQLHFADSPARHIGGTTGVFDELSVAVYTDGSPDSDLLLRLDAPAGLYDAAELRFIGAELIAYIRALVAAGDQRPVGALDVLTGAERDRVLTAPDDTAVPPPGPTVPELFARQVERAPDAAALVSGDTEVSYRELDERSDRLAEALRRRGVGPDTVVAVTTPRSVDLATALLAVAKAGGASVLSADPGVPAVAFDDLLADTGEGDGNEAREAPLPARADNLLAVAQASGPAGEAAVLAVTHANTVWFATDRHRSGGGHDAVLWHSPPTAEGLALELWAPLLNGGRVVVAPPGELDADALTALREAHPITAVRLSAGLFSAIAAEHPSHLAGLREVRTDGVSAAAVRRVREACPELAVVNGDGPADGTARYVLGPGLAPVPAGVTGELYVAGPGVARGWAGRPGRTAECFVPCPFGPDGGVMYRTGERARWGASGLEHAGRADARADVRGVLVETAEVEDVLSEHPGLAQVAVATAPDDSGQRRLTAYVVPAGVLGAGGAVPPNAPAVDELRRFAAGRLPESMVPSAFVVLGHLPAGADGRVDRAALPAPEFGDGRYRAPRDHTEKVLAEAFADVLELDRVGIDEDFFDLGGNSLKAIRLVGLIRAELNLEVSIRTLFAARTITGLTDMWADLNRSSRPALRRRTKDGEVL
ncbi:condensation domain-containing protein [Yinghuangia seranimata]|uniref:condensation domain-containing protein n=1 Tax=Yinghuangia seranimata TaxID=408067 RepID=UPI00248BB75A|nr:condensation domain-containing protein [Yinghuangia seranimata]MDI2127097.1 condensation domain-containing protein [Yinghuangia seranimata]